MLKDIVILTTWSFTSHHDNEDFVSSVDVQGNDILPGHFVGLFGYKSQRTIIPDVNLRARQQGKILRIYSVLLKITNPSVSVSAKNFQERALLRLDSMRMDMQHIIANVLEIPQQELLKEVERKPQLIEKIWEMDMFSHFRIISWPATYTFGTKRLKANMACVRSPQDIDTIQRMHPQQDVPLSALKI